MTVTYTKYEDAEWKVSTIHRVNEDGTETVIPTDPANSDYQAYLATLAANSATPQA